jgi:hypothetical protein
MQGNREQRNQQANLPFFNIKMMTSQMTCKGEQKQICSGKGEKKMVDLG